MDQKSKNEKMDKIAKCYIRSTKHIHCMYNNRICMIVINLNVTWSVYIYYSTLNTFLPTTKRNEAHTNGKIDHCWIARFIFRFELLHLAMWVRTHARVLSDPLDFVPCWVFTTCILPFCSLSFLPFVFKILCSFLYACLGCSFYLSGQYIYINILQNKIRWTVWTYRWF